MGRNMQKLVLDIIKGYECQTSPPGNVPRVPSLVFREHPPAHGNVSGVPQSGPRCQPCGIHNPRQALALCVAKFEVCAQCHLTMSLNFICGAFNDSIRERLLPPRTQQGNGKVQTYGDQHCLDGARDEMMAVDLMKQELSEEMSPLSSLAHGNVGESPADELP